MGDGRGKEMPRHAWLACIAAFGHLSFFVYCHRAWPQPLLPPHLDIDIDIDIVNNMPHSTLVEQHPSPDILSSYSSSPFQVEDFFNLDLLSGISTATPNNNNSNNSNNNNNNNNNSAPSNNSLSTDSVHSGAASSSSRSSSRSPSGSSSHLPPTPPQSDMAASFDIGGMDLGAAAFGGLPAIDEESMFTFSYDGVAPSTWVWVAPLRTLLLRLNPPSASGSSSSNPYPLAIDPQLVGSSAPSSASQREDDSDEERDADDDFEELAPVKVGGKGKSRRGTLHSGGIVKKSAAGPPSIFSSLSNGEKPLGGKSIKDDMDLDDWRPSPEEYSKMSSKEKRQLRNKISARNFRYIHTLEGDIAERDRLIDAIRGELGSTKSENSALRQEVATLKKAILEGRASPMLPPPAPLSPLSPLSSFASLQPSSSSNNNSNNKTLIKPNTHKDLPTSPRLAAIGGSGAFWGGQKGGFGSMGGGVTPVHTAIIPETTFSASMSSTDRANENINPALNQIPVPLTVATNKVFGIAGGVNGSAQQQQQQQHQNSILMSQVLSQLSGGAGSFDSFSDVNPFTLKTLDAYRMQLWNRVAMQAHQQRTRAAQQSYPSPASANTSPA
ncbi:hypothetical protein EW145_g8257, partial [Phellinidium pouzarii]